LKLLDRLNLCRREDSLTSRLLAGTVLAVLLRGRSRAGRSPVLGLRWCRSLRLGSRSCQRRQRCLDSIRFLRRRLSSGTRGHGLGRCHAGLHPLSLSKARLRALSRGDARSNIDVCRRRRHPAFAVDVPVPSRDRDLSILGLWRERTGLLRGHLQRQPLLANGNTRSGLRLSLRSGLGGNRTALLWVLRLRGHTGTQPWALL
jgi:hypothetical protein